ncbi:hypothetical protein E2562_031875 [Oryza meyeriana var. granulata]|uniref:Non-haem dioxygenase N-terminal domain-containing protein n=1 Tax=Oryza meyeriana var. granulata TaxID=110450 RepID=A0A6G1F047_9ORYZ|nr:hypothetical protein E2562_031875 [Oryza meyeriana var. granulata]
MSSEGVYTPPSHRGSGNGSGGDGSQEQETKMSGTPQKPGALAGTCNGPDKRISERYIRTEINYEEVISDYHSSMSIPIIDVKKLLDPQSSKECAKLRFACEYWGFFQVIDHGVPDEVIGSLRNDIIEFLRQLPDAKKAYSQLPNSLEGYGQSFVMSEDQNLDWADMLYIHLHPSESRNMMFLATYPTSYR